MRILVAEDDPVSRRVLSATLEGMGHAVEIAADGLTAWARFAADQPDVLIADWMMPELDGLELVRRVREARRERYTYVLLLTALSGRARYLDGMAAGADDFVTKPVDRLELHARMRVAERILGLQREVTQLQGLLPICSYCKRIRDQADQWSQVEDYVARRSAAQFTHGVCPTCYDSHLRPQLEVLPLSPTASGRKDP